MRSYRYAESHIVIYASPDTWDELPMAVPPYEQPPATGPAQQLARSVPD